MTNNILVTDDDGFRRLDIRNLVKNVKNYSNVTVVISDSPKNAAGPNLTFCGFLTINEYTFDNIRFYAVGRLPTDRVKIVERKPNIILPSEYHNLIGHISVYVLSYEEILLSYLNVKYMEKRMIPPKVFIIVISEEYPELLESIGGKHVL